MEATATTLPDQKSSSPPPSLGGYAGALIWILQNFGPMGLMAALCLYGFDRIYEDAKGDRAAAESRNEARTAQLVELIRAGADASSRSSEANANMADAVGDLAQAVKVNTTVVEEVAREMRKE